jgi:hypothetical protein
MNAAVDHAHAAIEYTKDSNLPEVNVPATVRASSLLCTCGRSFGIVMIILLLAYYALIKPVRVTPAVPTAMRQV